MDRKGCARFSRSESQNGFSSLMAIGRVLIANRGEIAVRIARACREASIERGRLLRRRQGRVARAGRQGRWIGPAAPAESYLSVPALIAAAASSEADAIHPGYGFLSERAALPLACDEAGLIFIGPPARVMERMGSKIEARALMQSAGVPIVPGDTPRDQSDDGVHAAARRLGYPAVKASAGGGGKGMRIVRHDREARSQSPRRGAKPPPLSATARCMWSASSNGLGTSRSRSSPIRTATSSISSSASARSSVAIKRSSRRAHRRR